MSPQTSTGTRSSPSSWRSQARAWASLTGSPGGVVLDEAVAILHEEAAGGTGELERAIAVDGMGVECPALVGHAGFSQSAAGQLRRGAIAGAIVEDDVHAGSVVSPTG